MTTSASKSPTIQFSEQDKHGVVEESTSYADRLKDKMNPPSRSSTSSSGEFDSKSRKSSFSSIGSDFMSKSRRSSSSQPKKPKAQSHTFSDVGRHSNQWLFGDMSITKAVKTLFEK